jgi:hypothetical protein
MLIRPCYRSNTDLAYTRGLSCKSALTVLEFDPASGADLICIKSALSVLDIDPAIGGRYTTDMHIIIPISMHLNFSKQKKTGPRE